MKTRRLGRSGLQVSEVSLGSWLTFGSSVERKATREIVQAAYDLGVNLFDSADVYGNGAGEEALGFALREVPRHTVVIATKAFFPMSPHPNDCGLPTSAPDRATLRSGSSVVPGKNRYR